MKKTLTFLFFIVLLFCLLTGKAFAATYTVTNSADSGAGSLRQAITDANGNSGTDIIEFQIPTSEATSEAGIEWWRIELSSSFPSITDTVYIDGTTQATMTNEVVQGNPLGPEIEITNSSPSSFFIVFTLSAGASNSTIEGLVINNFKHPLVPAIYLQGGDNCRIYGCYLGTDVTGQTAKGNNAGIALTSGSSYNLIGSTESSRRNIISGNTYGIYMNGSNVTSNEVIGNYIGTRSDGLDRVAAGQYWGVVIDGGKFNRIGGTVTGEGNLISGNVNAVTIAQTGANSNEVLGNLIGTDKNGTASVYNGNTGIFISGEAQYNKIGDGTPAGRNIISKNLWYGIRIRGTNTNYNEVLGNYVGLDINGSGNMGNDLEGVWIYEGAAYNKIQGNVISMNRKGVRIVGTNTNSNEVLGNIIGLAPDGVTVKGNNEEGVYIETGARYNKIGDGTPDGRNIISANGYYGVVIKGNPPPPGVYVTQYNQVLGNFIGTDITGAVERGNGWAGVFLYAAASFNRVEGNVISGNGTYGVHLDGGWIAPPNWPADYGVSSNEVFGNFIGTTSNGAQYLGNFSGGVFVENKAIHNLIGGNAAGQGNLISGNSYFGVMVDGCSWNKILGNLIGTTSNGAEVLSNIGNGVFIHGSGDIMIGDGTPGGRNIISGNTEKGIWIYEAGGTQVLGNYIGTDITGMQSLGNTKEAVAITGEAFTANNLIGNGTPGGRNIISGNHWWGILISGAGASWNQIHGNFIGTDVTGGAALENAGVGVRIESGASYNSIGGNTTGQGNVISGNVYAIEIDASNGNNVLGNLIGTTSDGASALGNERTAVHIANGAQENHIGDGISGGGNKICAAEWYGVRIRGTDTNSNEVEGNYIGGISEEGFGNALGGVVISEGASYNMVGKGFPLSRNIIVGNGWEDQFRYGILIYDVNTNYNQVVGNYIGVDEDGATPLPNSGVGVAIWEGASYNKIGGGGDDQVISGNTEGGINIGGQDGKICEYNQILGNIIGTDKDEQIPLGNGEDPGISIRQYTRYTSIGDGTSNGQNIICAHKDSRGIRIGGATSVEVFGNNIGWVDGPWGTFQTYENNTFGNSGEGIVIQDGSSFITIGGTNEWQGNVILGNQESGISIQENSEYVRVVGNLIQGNRGFGVSFDNISQYNQISSNFIIFNGMGGVLFFGGAANNVLGPANYIAANGTGEAVQEFYEIVYGFIGVTLEPSGVLAIGETNIPALNLTKSNTITQNFIYENLGLGILLYNWGNDGMPAPTIESVGLSGSTAIVTGKAIAYSTVEVFQANGLDPFSILPWVGPDPSGAGEGLTYLGSTIAGPTGNWSKVVTVTTGDPVITATATDTIGNTSMFSVNMRYVTDTETPEVIVLKPRGGETWYIEAKQDISWAVIDDINAPMQKHNIYLSLDGGQTWPEEPTLPDLAVPGQQTGVTGAGKYVYKYTYNWTVPSPAADAAKMRVEAIDWGEPPNHGFGESGKFRIKSVPAFITITDPALDDRLKGGAEHEVIYQTSPGVIPPIKVYYSTAGAQSWVEASPPEEDGDYSYTWNVPDSSIVPYSDNCYLRMEASDSYGRDFSGQSERFTIDNQPPSVNVSETRPLNGATNVPQNTQIKVVFSEPMNTYSVDQAFSLKLKEAQDQPRVSGDYSWSEDETTLFFTAFLGMDLKKEYIYSVTDVAADSVGNTLTDPFSASFITTATAVPDAAIPEIGAILADGEAIADNDPINPTPKIETTIKDNRIYPFGIKLTIDDDVKTYQDFEYVESTLGPDEVTIKIIYQVPQAEALEKYPVTHSIKVEARDAAGVIVTKERIGLYYDPGEAKIRKLILRRSGAGAGAAGASFSPAERETITIAYMLSKRTDITFYAHSPTGEIVWTKRIVAGVEGAKTGYNEVVYNGIDDISGAPLANGIYPLRITSNGEVIGKAYIVVFNKKRP